MRLTGDIFPSNDTHISVWILSLSSRKKINLRDCIIINCLYANGYLHWCLLCGPGLKKKDSFYLLTSLINFQLHAFLIL